MRNSLLCASVSRALMLGIALLFVNVGQAHAYRFFLTSDYAGGLLAPDATFAVDVHLDTEGASDISLLSIAVDFDPSALAYEQLQSSTTSYLLYTPAAGKANPGRWLEPVGSCAGAPALGCGTWVGSGDPSLVIVDFYERNFATGGGTVATTDDAVLATLVFRSLAGGAAPFPELLFHSSSILRLGSGATVVPNLEGTLIVTPEPATALLLGLGLAGLGVAGSGKRGRTRRDQPITPAGGD